MKLAVDHRALREAPVYETHKRGRNWMAQIGIDPTCPGGLSRQFAHRARGDYLYLIEDWMQPHVAVEFGADYYTGGGKRHPVRWYGVICEVNEEVMKVEECGTAVEAVKLSEARKKLAKLKEETR
jgi:hypothetical protein